MSHPPQRTRWGRLFAWVIGSLILTRFLLSNWMYWPPNWVERRTQRQRLHARVEAAGGWEAVQRDCDALADQHPAPGWYWPSTANNPPLPPTLAALNPRGVYYMPQGRTREEAPEPQVPIFRMKFFGGRNTGEPATPYFGLEVVVGPNYKTYRPRPGGSTDGSSRRSYRRVTDRIYEVY